MFKFGFSSDPNKDGCDDEQSEVEKKSYQKWDECQELRPADCKLLDDILTSAQFKVINLSGIEIKYVCSKQVFEVLTGQESSKNTAILKAEQNHSDLLPAVYEGGFKIWECTHDLLNHLNDSNLDFRDKKVLDLGCGAGILGIYTLLKGSSCCFQDYNSDVLEYITIPNVWLNSMGVRKPKFYSGDWQHFLNVIDFSEDNKFDFILTSETIYNTENYYKLHDLFVKLLKCNGTIYLAAKSFYFGVGGGISLFEEYIDKYNVFQYSCCWKCEDGVKREILKIQFTDP